MVTVTGLECDKEARVRVMPKAMRVVGDEEGEGSKAMATATRVVGERCQWQRGWWVVGEEEGEVGKGDGDCNEERTTRRRRDVMTTRRRRDDDET
jgi:hypothetical protein